MSLAVPIGLAVFGPSTMAQGQIAIQDGSPLTMTHSTGTALSQPFTVTAGADALVVILEDRGASLPEPATLTWNGQTLTRSVQTAHSATPARSLAIYHLYNPQPGTANITGTVAGVSDKWVTAYTLNGVATDIVPTARGVNTGNGGGAMGLSVTVNGVANGAWAAVSSTFSNLGSVSITGTGGTGATVSAAGPASTTATAGYVAGLSAGTVTLSSSYVPNLGADPQKSNFAAVIFTPSSTYPPQRFGIKFLGNTTHAVTSTAGVVPMPNWNNIANASFTTGSILSSNGAHSATLTISGSGGDRAWRSGVYPDGGNLSLVYGYQDAGINRDGINEPAINVISGLTASAYDVYLYTAGESIRPASATEYLSNYTINGTTFYTSTKDGRSVLWNMVRGVTIPTNSNQYPSALVPGHYLRINNVSPVNGAITIAANTDGLSFRSPLNGIQLIQRGNAPQILTHPLDHRLYTGGTLQLEVEAQSANAMSYRWRRNGVDLVNGARISGADTNSLTITNLVLSDSGDYDVVVTNNFGSAASETKHTEVVVMTQADAAFEAWLATYKRVDERGATFITESIDDRQWVWAWQQAFIHWSITDAYNRTRSPDHKRLIYDLQNTFLKQEGNTLTWQDWNDDIQWEVIALSKGYPITGNPLARETAISAWNAVMNRAWDDTFGGGIWQKMPVGNSKTVLSNCPQIIGGLELYKITGDNVYITKSETIYNWVRANLFMCTPQQAVGGLQLGQLIEGIAYLNDAEENGQTRLISNNVYNSGLFVQSACGLYEVTGNQQYLDDAILAANYMVNRQPIMDANNINNGYFGAEQLVRAVAKLGSLNNNKLWPTYWPWMRAQCAAAWAMRRTDRDITRNRWTSPTPSDIDLKALETHSAFLVQQLTPVTLPTFVDWTTKLTGAIIGTTGTFGNGNTRDKALDGNVATYFDAPTANGAWVGLDLGTAKKVSAIRYYPRTSEPDRMLGGVFQGANQANFSDAVTLYPVVIQPSLSVYHLMPVTSTQSFRYVRYLSPNAGWGNVSEVEFYAPAAPPPAGPDAPGNLQARRNATSAVINWAPVAGAVSYKVKRATALGGPYLAVSGNVATTSYVDAINDAAGRYFYVVSGVSNVPVEGTDSAAVEAVDSYRAWVIARGISPDSPHSAFNADANGDGISNGVEYAAPGGLKATAPAGSSVQLTADVRADELLSVVLVKSGDLVQWTDLPAMQVIEPSDAAAGFRRLSLTDPMADGEKVKFYRLQFRR